MLAADVITGRAWMLFKTSPQHLGRVMRILTATAIEYFLPLCRLIRIHHGRRIEKLVNAFGVYVFVRVDNLSAPVWQRLEGMVYFVRVGSQLATVRDSVVEAIRARLDRNGVLEIPVVPRFVFGQKVVFKGLNSVFGTVGVYQRSLDRGRAEILLPWFGGLKTTSVAEDELESLSQLRRKYRQKRHGHRGKNRYRNKAFVNASVGHAAASMPA